MIEDNVEEALSGVKGELAVKIFGDDLKVLEQKGEEVRKVIDTVRGRADLAIAEPLSGQPNLTVKVDRDAIARYGLDGQTVLSLVETGLGGKTSGSILQGQRRFDICLRLSPSARNAVGRIGDLWVDTPDRPAHPPQEPGHRSSLEEAPPASAATRTAAGSPSSAASATATWAASSTRPAARSTSRCSCPPATASPGRGSSRTRSGPTPASSSSSPLSLLMVLVLLFWAFQRLRYAAADPGQRPLRRAWGRILLLYLTGTHLSVSAMIGFIALSGVSVQNGIVLIGQFNQLRVKGMPLHEAVLEGSKNRLRPVLMTALMAAIGMYPAATSTGIGSEVQRPLALVILGGMMSPAVLTLLVLPALYELFEILVPRPGDGARRI